MFFDTNWHIAIGTYKLAMLDGVEIHKSVDLLANTCAIKLPGSAYNKALKIEGSDDDNPRIKRGDKVMVELGYNGRLKVEYEGYLLNILTDDGSITINCENDLFLLRKAIPNKEFAKTTVKQIAQYAIDKSGVPLKLNCTLAIDYDKFVVANATAYDVLKKLKEETKGNIFLTTSELHIHPPYIQKTGDVKYSFQENIESSDLKYVRAEDKILQVVVENTGADGKKKTSEYGITGGDKITISGNGLSESSMRILAENKYKEQMYDGYEGSINTWLIPFVEPGYSARVEDSDYEFKNGTYYVTSVTTTFDSSGGVRKVQLGKRLN